MAAWSNGHNQIWFIRDIKNGNIYELGSKAHPDSNLEIFSSFSQSHVHIGKKFNKDAQKWIFEPKGACGYGQLFAIKSVGSGLYLTIKKGEKAVVIDKFQDQNPTFLWIIGPAQGGQQQQGWGQQ